MLRSLSVMMLICGSATPVLAQNQVVQQPVVQQTQIGTAVSVPDRGRAFLGGVSRGAVGTNRYGPFRSGTNSGREFSGSSQTVSVQILDYEELDQAALNAARNSSPRREAKRLNPRATHAWRTLAARHANR